MESAPTPPSMRLLPLLPKIEFARPLPKPCRSAPPCRTRVSTFAVSVVVDGREDRVGTLVGILDHGVAGVVDEVRVVARAAAHDVGAGATVDEIVAGIAGQRVGQAVAEALQVGNAGQNQILHVGSELVVDRRLDRIGACAGAFGHHVAGIVDKICVVADAAGHDVDAIAAVEHVVARAAEHPVVAVAADEGVVAAQAFD